MSPYDYKALKPLDDPTTLFDLTDRVGIITGGSGKMGRYFAMVLAKAGAQIVLVDLDKSECHAAAQEISRLSGRSVMAIACDVSQESQVLKLFKKTADKFGRLDFLVHNVMSKPPGYYRDFFEYEPETWNQVMAGNLTGAFLCSREAAKLMKQKSGGSIVMTSSIYGIVGPDQRIYEHCSPAANLYGGTDPLNTPGAYTASKGGLSAFAKYLATLLGPDQIRVNVLVPGGVYDGQEETFHEAYAQRTPLNRMAIWSDFSGAILFLVSDASRYMTGTQMVIDGGWTAW